MNIEYFDDYLDFEDYLKQKRLDLLNTLPEGDSDDSKIKIIKLLELEYSDIEKQQIALLYSNEQMLKCDINDIILIECRAENMKFIEKNFKLMNLIKEKILFLDKNNSIKDRNPISEISEDNTLEFIPKIQNNENRQIDVITHNDNLINEIDL